MSNIDFLVKEHIKNLKPYSSARDEFSGLKGTFLDANENPYGKYNRYPDPYQKELKSKIAEIKKWNPDNIFIGNGSDEIIDSLFRIICSPKKDKVLIFPPTYGMYKVSAEINNIEVVEINLDSNFQINLDYFFSLPDLDKIKIVFICSPNNPTGNEINKSDIITILDKFNGIVVVDEAYNDFSSTQSFSSEINKYPNLVVLQTLSKARSMASLRIGVAYTSSELIKYLNKVKAPYNVSGLTQQTAIKILDNEIDFNRNLIKIIDSRNILIKELKKIENIVEVYPSDANFIFVKTTNANKIYDSLINKKLIVRNRNSVLKNCLRITVGSPEENDLLIQELNNIKI